MVWGASAFDSALATTAPEVSGTSPRGAIEIELVIGVGWDETAEATLTGPALMWTVFTLTGFIGSLEPGMAAIGWVWITPLLNGSGSGLDSGFDCAGGTAAAAAASTEGFIERIGGWAAGSEEAEAT